MELIDQGQVLFQKARGLSNIKDGTPLTTDTVFELASCSKQFTAVAVMMLADRGKLSFSDDAAKYLPEFGKEANFTIADLLHMTTGLADWRDYVSDSEMTNESIAKLAAEKPRKFKTGSQFEYCNTNYVLLALIVTRLSGLSFPEFMQKEVFIPLGMKHSLVITRKGQEVPGRAGGYIEKNGDFEWTRSDSSIVGHGHLTTTLADLLIWFNAIDQNKLVKPETMRLAYTSGELDGGEKTGYGFGWYVDDDDNHLTVSHKGRWRGTATYIKRDLSDQETIIVLSNNESMAVDELAGTIAGLMDDEN